MFTVRSALLEKSVHEMIMTYASVKNSCKTNFDFHDIDEWIDSLNATS